jgi:hypothetical protein
MAVGDDKCFQALNSAGWQHPTRYSILVSAQQKIMSALLSYMAIIIDLANAMAKRWEEEEEL